MTVENMASKFCTRCGRLTDHQTHRHDEALQDRQPGGTRLDDILSPEQIEALAKEIGR